MLLGVIFRFIEYDVKDIVEEVLGEVVKRQKSISPSLGEYLHLRRHTQGHAIDI